MGQPINFAGSNVIMRAPADAENVQDMHVFQTRHSCVSCWDLSADELAEINATGRIFLSVLAGGQQPPVYVGSESTCREVMIDFGPVWPIERTPDVVIARREVDDETAILQRLADGDTIVFSMDGDMAWFTKGDRAFVGNSIMSLREKGFLLRKRDVGDDDDPRGVAAYDTISEAGRAALTSKGGGFRTSISDT